MARDPAAAETYFRALIERRPDNPSGWAGLWGALVAQGRAPEEDPLIAGCASPAGASTLERIAGRQLSPRGFIFDPDERLPIRRISKALHEVASSKKLRALDNVVFYLDRGGELIERQPAIDLDGAVDASVTVRHRTPAKFVASLRNAAVFNEGLVLTEDGGFIEGIHPPAAPRKYGAVRTGDVLSFPDPRSRGGRLPVKVIDTPVFLMSGVTDSAFGDFIVNFAPRLALAEAAGLDCPILLRWKPQAQVLSILGALGVGPERILFHDPGEITLVPKLYAPSWPTWDKGAPMRGVFDIYRRAVLPPTGERPLVYLTRQGVAARPLSNEAEVCELFASRGFRIVNPGELSFEEVRRLLAHPACVAGPFGSAFHNLVFSGGHPLSLVLMPPHVPFHLTEIALWQADLGNRFAYVMGDMPPEPHRIDTPWTISLDKVERALDRMLRLIEQSQLAEAG
jgi:hypothetical protein